MIKTAPPFPKRCYQLLLTVIIVSKLLLTSKMLEGLNGIVQEVYFGSRPYIKLVQ